MNKTSTPRALGKTLETPITTIKPAPDNPRKIPEKAIEQVAKSIQQFGWQQPLVIDTNRVIIAGHTRYLAAKKLGLKTVPCIKATHLTPEQAHAYRIADNRSHDYTTWDYPELIQQINELDDFNDVLDITDWVNNELEELTQTNSDLEEEPYDSGTAETYKTRFELVIECQDENHQEKLFNQLTSQGEKCRLLTL